MSQSENISPDIRINRRVVEDVSGGEVMAEFLIEWEIPYVFGLVAIRPGTARVIGHGDGRRVCQNNGAARLRQPAFGSRRCLCPGTNSQYLQGPCPGSDHSR
jgi:hypothetical protein